MEPIWIKKRLDNRIIIFGTGGHSKVLSDVARACHMEVAFYFDQVLKEKAFLGTKIELYDPNRLANVPVHIAIGQNDSRKKVVKELSHPFTSIIHPSSLIANDVEIQEGTAIIHSAVIQTNCSIGKHCIINTAAVVDHDNTLEDFVHIGPNATLCGGVSIGEGTLIGAGSTVIPEVTIGKWVTVGAGSAVVNDVPDHTIVMGNPAKVVKYHSSSDVK